MIDNTLGNDRVFQSFSHVENNRNAEIVAGTPINDLVNSTMLNMNTLAIGKEDGGVIKEINDFGKVNMRELVVIADKNEDGKLSGKEMRDLRKRLDADGDKRISVDELIKVVLDKESVLKADLNHDGFINRGEIIKAGKEDPIAAGGIPVYIPPVQSEPNPPVAGGISEPDLPVQSDPNPPVAGGISEPDLPVQSDPNPPVAGGISEPDLPVQSEPNPPVAGGISEPDLPVQSDPNPPVIK